MHLDRDSLRQRLVALIDGADRSFLTEFSELLDLPGDITAADHYQPGHLTASGFVVSPDATSVALVYHRKLRRWLQPGGHLESVDADLEGAARRELAEEVGLVTLSGLGMFDIDIHTFPARSDTPEHLHFDVRFAFRSPSSDLAVLDGITDARWFDFDDLQTRPVDESIRRPVSKLSRLLHSGA